VAARGRLHLNAAAGAVRRAAVVVLLLALAAVAGLAVLVQAGPAQAQSAPPPSAAPAAASALAVGCEWCRERLHTVDALRSALPADWSVRREAEPVLGGEMLVVRTGPPRAPRLLLVHGLGQNGFTDWMPVLPQLARRGNVTAVDLPGFGYSSAPLAKLSPTQYARVLAALVEREGAGPVTVVGHSLGGAVALRLAEQHPAAVSRLVLVDVAGILHRTAFTKHLAGLPVTVDGVPEALKEPVARLRDLANLVVERVFGLPGDPTRVLRESEALWALVLRDRVSANAAMALVDEDFSAAVHTLAQPVWLIWGEADAVAPLRTGELLGRRLPQAELATLPGVGHVPMAQASNDFLALLVRALDQPPVPRPAQTVQPAQPALSPTADPLPDLHCSGQVDRHYRGRYREVHIDRCTAVRLTDVVAERIVVHDSIVQMLGVQVAASDIALTIVNSELIATASDFTGRLAIRTDASRLDLAGVRLQADGFAVQALRRSRLLASVSQVRDAFYSGHWHDDRELEGELLDLRAAPRPAVRQ
jgi:pimeloyl-ACP methyl ester carboxylesterase